MIKQLDEYEIDQFLYSFDPLAYGAATKISQFLKKKDLKHFTDRLLVLIADYRNEKIILPIIQFISFVVYDPKYIPGNAGFELNEILTSSRTFTEAIINRFMISENVEIKRMIINELFNLNSFFTDEEIDKITTQSVQKDFYLIPNILFFHQSNFVQFIADIVHSQKTASIWALLQYFIESGELELEEHLPAITEMGNKILNEKIRQYREILKLNEQMIEDNRIEYTEVEMESVENFKFDFTDFLNEIIKRSSTYSVSAEVLEEMIQEFELKH